MRTVWRTPVILKAAAWYEDKEGTFEIVAKLAGISGVRSATRRSMSSLGMATMCLHKYDLRRFNTIGSISFDHPDPSISPY